MHVVFYDGTHIDKIAETISSVIEAIKTYRRSNALVWDTTRIN